MLALSCCEKSDIFINNVFLNPGMDVHTVYKQYIRYDFVPFSLTKEFFYMRTLRFR